MSEIGDEPTSARVAHVAAMLWPAFLAAALAEFVVFAVVDPASLHLPGGDALSRQVIYTLAFFAFWVVGALSSALTFYLTRAGARAPVPGDLP